MGVIARISRIAGVIVIQACVLLGVLEVAGRIFDPLGVSYYPEMARYLDTLIQEEPIGYRNQPGLKGQFFGTSVQINAHGMRNKEIPSDTSPDNFRILFLGDSVPFGVGVEQEDTLPAQLENIANSAARGGSQVYEVINMGVPSYNTEQELIQLKTVGIDLAPDLVLLLFTRNDIEPKMWVFDKRAGWMKNIIQRSYAGSLLFLAYREFRTWTPSIIKSSNASTNVDDELQIAFRGYKASQDRWQKLRSSMAEINSLLRSREIPFVVFLNQENNYLAGLLDHEAQLEDFLFVHLLPWQDPRWMGSDIKNFTNSVTDSHPNKDGNSILAALVYESLIDLKLLAAQK